MSAVLRADWIGRSFRGRRVLTTATLHVHAGEIVALLGRNGTGKSTLLRICAGVLRADHGVLHFAGDVVRRPRLHYLARRGLFLLPERGLLARGRSLDAQIAQCARRWNVADVGGALNRLELQDDELLQREVVSLSSGERRRAEFALAYMRRPVCLLGDEPFQGIAPNDVERISDVMRELAAAGCAIVVTGHEVPPLLAVADRIVWLTAGTTHDLGSPEHAVEHHSFRADYLSATHH